MFDGNVVKNTANPAELSNGTNKLKWTSNNRSHVSDLGKDKTGLFAFNDSIKNSIKYMYLNNNSFSDVNSLIDFKNIVELQLQCNSNLSNIDGLKDHGNLEILTLHNCSLKSLVDFSSKNLENDTKVSKLSKLTVQGNVNLESLNGIDDSKDIIYLIANNCNLTDIDSLKNHSKVTYLDLANNVHLQSVKYIQHCKALKYIYLDNNVEMINNELNLALNGTSEDKEFGQNILIKNCINGYKNIPQKYWELFEGTATVLDYSYGTLNEYLTTDSPKWLNLIGRTDITKLKLDGQIYLPMEDEIKGEVKYSGMKTVLSGLTGMKALSLYGCTQVNSIDFAQYMTNLYEIDLRSVSNTLTDLSILDSSTSLNRLIVNNPDIDATGIQNLINRFNAWNSDSAHSWYDLYLWNCSGYVAENDLFPSFENCSLLKNFIGGNMGFDDNKVNRVLDLSDTTIETFGYYGNCPREVRLPSTCTYAVVDNFSDAVLVFDGVFEGYLKGNHITQISLDRLSNWNIKNSEFDVGGDYDVVFPAEIVDKFFKIGFGYKSEDVQRCSVDVGKLNYSGLLRILNLYNKVKIINIENLANLTDLECLYLINDGIYDIGWISSLRNLKSLKLSYNEITDISSLSNLEKIGENSADVSIDNNDCFYLNNNSISDITPLALAIGDDGVINYKSLDISYNSLDGSTVADNVGALLKLHRAGLEKVTITGNNFTGNEIQDLITGKTIDGEVYTGFGEGNVIN